MSIVIVGGNECMVRRYIDLCRDYNCRAKVFCKMRDGLKNGIGSPDLMVLFTSTMSHKMIKFALGEVKGTSTMIERSHSASLCALREILDRTAVRV
ncbi:MAG: DUF2325 domain-containing protein [Clostridia bacterium]|nr:DUF2325 domain-containing protein [Clostridia bacterium]